MSKKKEFSVQEKMQDDYKKTRKNALYKDVAAREDFPEYLNHQFLEDDRDALFFISDESISDISERVDFKVALKDGSLEKILEAAEFDDYQEYMSDDMSEELYRSSDSTAYLNSILPLPLLNEAGEPGPLLDHIDREIKYPIMPIMETICYPNSVLSFIVEDPAAASFVQYAIRNTNSCIVLLGVDPELKDNPDPEKGIYYEYGCLARVNFLISDNADGSDERFLPDSNCDLVLNKSYRATLQAIAKVKVSAIEKGENKDDYCLIDFVDYQKPEEGDLREIAGEKVKLLSAYREYLLPRFKPEQSETRYRLALSTSTVDSLMDLICTSVNFDAAFRQEQLEENNILKRMRSLRKQLKKVSAERAGDDFAAALAERMSEMSEIHGGREDFPDFYSEDIGGSSLAAMQYEGDDQAEKELFEKNKKRILKMRKNLRTDDPGGYYKKIMLKDISDENLRQIVKEINFVESSPRESSADVNSSRNWLDFVCNLPFGKMGEEDYDIKKARKILDDAHYGLDQVKERILEYLSVMQLRQKSGKDVQPRGAIICLTGPPGVGKTSVAKSIAEATGRKYARMSLGGVRDEAEIRGHRKTYVSALPGRIMTAIEKAGTDNPLILLDEVDKLTSDRNGDPTSALLEALDPEQNNSFEDHFVGMPYDLSKVMFVTTANYAGRIPRPLLDRMELIEIEGYTDSEKMIIAKKFLLPQVLKKNGLKASMVNISDAAMRKIIRFYTKEAGLRELERQLEKAARKSAIEIAEKGKDKVSVSVKNIEDFLGPPIYTDDLSKLRPAIGSCYGLAVSELGGDLLRIEVNAFEGKGKLELTGRLGDVMKESAKTAISYIRSRCEDFGIENDFAEKTDLHIHVPFGATPKEGPSAGITLATALISELTQTPVRRDVAMTGEISLHGDVLPIGGLKGKSAAAFRAGIKKVLFPQENAPGVDEIPDEIKNSLEMVPVSHMDEVIKEAFEEFPRKKASEKNKDKKEEARKSV